MSSAPVALSAPPQPETDPDSLELVLARFRLRARRRVAWLRKLWSEETERGELAVTHAELDGVLADRDAPSAEDAWLAGEPTRADLDDELCAVEAALAADSASRLARVVRVFELSPHEVDVLEACLAPALDPTLERACAYLNDHAGRGYVTEGLVARLYGHGRTSPWTSATALRAWRLVTASAVAPGEPLALGCDPLVRDWLRGSDRLDDSLAAVARRVPALPALASWPLAATVARVETLVADGGEGALVRVAGMPGSGRKTFAAGVAASLGLAALAVDADAVDDAAWPEVSLRAERQAWLDGCALVWHGDAIARRSWPREATPFPLQFVVSESLDARPPAGRTIDHVVELRPLAAAERRTLWRSLVPASAGWPAEEVEALARHHRATVADVVAVARARTSGPEDARERLRERGRHRLERLAQRLDCPFDWDDLVVPDALRQALEDFAFEAARRADFWERAEARRLFPHGRGLLALFTGPPGTGKTMAAQVLARSLGHDLFRIDLSGVVSKYVGETAQNLERILSRAAGLDALLLFDEADALFAKRTEVKDAHDRYANTDTGYLLQAIESYQGVALLATNKKGNIDSAFVRRLRYVLEFPKPDAAHRERIWRQVVGELAGAGRLRALAGPLGELARSVETTGAQIKLAVLAALFAAARDERPLAVSHLLRGLDRELAKEGRGLSVRERERLDRGG